MRPPGPPAGSPRRPRPRGAPSPGAGCVTPRLPRPPAASERLPAPSTPQPGADHKEGSALRAARIRGDPWQRPRTGPSLPAPPAPPARPRRRGRMHKARPRAPTGFHTAAGPGRRGAGGGLGWDAGAPGQPPDRVRGGVAAPRGASGKRPRPPAPHPPPRQGPRPRPGLQTRGGGCGKRGRRRRHPQRPSPAMARITHPSPRREAPVGEGGRGASRESPPHAVLPAPCRCRRWGCDGGPGLSAPPGDNVIPHTPHT